MTTEELTGELGKLEFRLNNRLIALENKPEKPCLDLTAHKKIDRIKTDIIDIQNRMLVQLLKLNERITALETPKVEPARVTEPNLLKRMINNLTK